MCHLFLVCRQNPVPNAYTLAIAGRKPFIVVHTALLELLTPQELQARRRLRLLLAQRCASARVSASALLAAQACVG